MQQKSIEELLIENESEILKLREMLQLDPSSQYDQIWLLRYILSNKTAEQSYEPAKFTIKWYEDNKEDIQKVLDGKEIEGSDILPKFQVAGGHKFTLAGDPIFYVRIGLSNTKALMDAMDAEKVLHIFTLNRLKDMQYCDKLTREKGYFVKSITVLDFQGFSLMAGNDSRFNKVIGESSKINENLFPQMLGRSIFINTPSLFSYAFGVVSMLMSKRAVEKMVFCPGSNSGKPISACPYVRDYMNVDDVPTFLGGNCNCLQGCIGGVPNSQKFSLNGIDNNGLMSITVGARSYESLELPVNGGMKFTWTIKVESKKLEISILFKPKRESGNEDQILVEKQFIDGEHEGLSGEFNATQDGTVVLLFDNQKSILTSKKVLYKIDIQ